MELKETVIKRPVVIGDTVNLSYSACGGFSHIHCIWAREADKR